MAGALGSYQHVGIATADPATLVVHLFDGALRFLARCRRAAAAGNQADFAYALSRAHAIIAELSNVLDRETGGEVAQNLSAVYDFALRHLTEGLVRCSVTHVEQVATILQSLRDGFDAARER